MLPAGFEKREPSVPGIQDTQLYCLADRTYFDTPARLPDEESRYRLDTDPPPEGWRREAVGLWTSLVPEHVEPAEQGWKIHVSTVPGEAEATLRDTARICVRHGVPFKFLRSEKALLLVAGKHMNRSGAGKFIAAYPPDETVFLALADELSRTLAGRSGPYVLSDLRIGDAPVYTRYGAFVPRWCDDAEGRRVLALRDPSGRLVPDERGVVFRMPSWVEAPRHCDRTSRHVPPPATTPSRTRSPEPSSSPTPAGSTSPRTAGRESAWCCARRGRTADSTARATTPSPACTASTGH